MRNRERLQLRVWLNSKHRRNGPLEGHLLFFGSVSYFSHCYDQIPDNKILKEGSLVWLRVLLALSFLSLRPTLSSYFSLSVGAIPWGVHLLVWNQIISFPMTLSAFSSSPSLFLCQTLMGRGTSTRDPLWSH